MFWFSLLADVIDENGDEQFTHVFYALFGVTSLLFLADLIIWLVIFGLRGLRLKKIFLIEVLL